MGSDFDWGRASHVRRGEEERELAAPRAGWTIREIVFCAQEARLAGLGKLSSASAPGWENEVGSLRSGSARRNNSRLAAD
jgi:hypothetical protein